MAFPMHIVAVGGIVQDENGNILLVKMHHNGWGFPGGQVEVRENLMEALAREIKEESGIEVEVDKLIGIYSNVGINKGHDGVTEVPTKLIMDYICKSIGGLLGILNETTESRWIPKEKVMEYLHLPVYRDRYQAFLDYSGQVIYKSFVTQPEFEVKLSRKI